MRWCLTIWLSWVSRWTDKRLHIWIALLYSFSIRKMIFQWDSLRFGWCSDGKTVSILLPPHAFQNHFDWISKCTLFCGSLVSFLDRDYFLNKLKLMKYRLSLSPSLFISFRLSRFCESNCLPVQFLWHSVRLMKKERKRTVKKLAKNRFVWLWCSLALTQ